MARSINQATLVGVVGRDAELRNTNGGAQVATFSLATSESWKDKGSGEWQEQTVWHNIVCWSGVAALAEKEAKKGRKLLIQGKISNRAYTDKDGNEKKVSEIIASTILPFSASSTSPDKAEQAAPLVPDFEGDDDSDSLPF